MPQPKLHWSAYLWPGLPQLWTRGSWAALGLAVGFTALANALAAATFVWHEWLSVEVRTAAAVAMSVVWVLAYLESRADWRRLLAELTAGGESAADPVERNDRWFREAQAAYLAGDWVSAERTLLELLSHEPRDAEAQLALATLLGHEGRSDAAIAELDRLERLEAASSWRREIAWERERIRANCVEQVASADVSAAGPVTLTELPTLTTEISDAEPAADSLQLRNDVDVQRRAA